MGERSVDPTAAPTAEELAAMADVVQVPSRAICCCLVFLSLFLRDCLRFQEAIEAGAAGVSSTFAEIHQVSNHHLTSSSPHLVLVLILIILTQSSSSSPNPHHLTSSCHLILSGCPRQQCPRLLVDHRRVPRARSGKQASPNPHLTLTCILTCILTSLRPVARLVTPCMKPRAGQTSRSTWPQVSTQCRA